MIKPLFFKTAKEKGMNNEQKNIKESSSIGNPSFLNQAYDYFYDSAQRSILCMDVLRKQGNIFKEHIENDLPPVLIFDYEVILDGRDLDRPCNHTLLHIIDKRKSSRTDPGTSNYTKKRKYFEYKGKPSDGYKRRPIIIIDPRAGHGPGIGGSKMSSEIGLALDRNHTVYFISFGPYPVPGQTLSDVNNAEIKFIEAVIKRHHSEKPIVIGNCQAGWAAAIIGAEHPDLVSAIIMNGAPLSYWAGVNGKNPMRYRGGLYGGVWLTSLLNDLGNGIFDGAFLVAGFEDLNPANTLWKKMYTLYSKVDTEEKRYLTFEKWWNGYFYMT